VLCFVAADLVYDKRNITTSKTQNLEHSMVYVRPLQVCTLTG